MSFETERNFIILFSVNIVQFKTLKPTNIIKYSV